MGERFYEIGENAPWGLPDDNGQCLKNYYKVLDKIE
jgi:hypothetical protein